MGKLRRLNSLPFLPDDLIEEILLRLPIDDPACLLRASLLSKSWRRTLSSPRFRRRLRSLGRVPPLLGFLHNWNFDRIPRFLPTTASKFFLAAPDRSSSSSWYALDCRHGCALFQAMGNGIQDTDLLVWEPLTGWWHRVPVPDTLESYSTAAVLCAVDGCDHLDCHGGPFRVVFVNCSDGPYYDEFVTSVRVYSSETDSWSEPASTLEDFTLYFDYGHSSLHVGRSLVYFMSDASTIREYNLARHRLTVFNRPPDQSGELDHERFRLMLAENGGLGVIEDLNPDIYLWSMAACDDADAWLPDRGNDYPAWVLSRHIDLELLLPFGATYDIRMGDIVRHSFGNRDYIR